MFSSLITGIFKEALKPAISGLGILLSILISKLTGREPKFENVPESIRIILALIIILCFIAGWLYLVASLAT